MSSSFSYLSCRTIRAFTVPGNIQLLSTQAGSHIERLKNPTRGGQNLSHRYRRLENSLRGKQSLSKALDEMPRASTHAGSRISVISSERDSANVLRGFRIPSKPKPPESDGARTMFITFLCQRPLKPLAVQV